MIIDVAIKPSQLRKLYEDDISALFSELARASILGYHRVFMTEDLADWVMDNINLSKKHRERIGYIKERIAERGAQVKYAKCKLIIEIGDKKYIKKDECEYHWRISHMNFIDGMTLDQSILLTENSLNDGQLFSWVFDLEAERIGLGPLNLFRFNGGGNGIHEIFSDIVKYKKICLGIADQDLYDTESKVGADLIKKYEEIEYDEIIGIADLTPGDQIENFLSFKVIDTIYNNLGKSFKNVFKDCVENLKKIEEIINNDSKIDASIWLKLDIKKEYIRKEFTKINTDYASKKLEKEYREQKIEIADDKPDGLSSNKFNLVKSFLGCSEAILEFEEFVKSDEWKNFFELWLEPKIWFLCGEDINSG